jgi:hypothetical protein
MHFSLDIRLKQSYIWITLRFSLKRGVRRFLAREAQLDVRENYSMKNATKKAVKKAAKKAAPAKKKK